MSHHDVVHLHALPNVTIKYQLPTTYGFCEMTGQDLKVKITTARSKVKSRPHRDIAYL